MGTSLACKNIFDVPSLSCRFYWIHVRDLANAHIKAINIPEAGGQRIIVAFGPFKWQDWGKCRQSIQKKKLN